jgi:adenosine deaminase
LTARVILCCICGLDQFSEDVIRLCVKYREQGVVGIDVAAGDGEALNPEDPDISNPATIKVFTDAKELGINRTVHAGEVGPAKCVEHALSKLFGQRIGHG